MKKQDILKESVALLLGDRPELIEVVMNTIPKGLYDAFSDDAKARFSTNSFLGSAILSSEVIDKRTSILRVGRMDNEITIGCSGHPILDVSKTIKIEIPNLSIWSKTWNTPLENKWLDFFDEHFNAIGEKLVIMHKIKDLSYEFNYSSEDRIHFSRNKDLNKLSSYCGGAFIYTRGSKFIFGNTSEVFTLLGDIKDCLIHKKAVES